MTQLDRQAVHDRIRMVLPALGQLVPHPLDRKAKRPAATVVPRTFREQGLGKQIPDYKPVPSLFGSEAQQLAYDRAKIRFKKRENIAQPSPLNSKRQRL